jgi:hypothetical protein
MKTSHSLIIGCAIILGFALHALMNRYEHSTTRNPEKNLMGRTLVLDKITGSIEYYQLVPRKLDHREKRDFTNAVVFPIAKSE